MARFEDILETGAAPKTDTGAHPAPCSMGTGGSLPELSNCGIKLDNPRTYGTEVTAPCYSPSPSHFHATAL
jgi:hypothetical protein